MVPTTKEAEMKVMIGIDPHKASHTAVAIGRDEDQIARVRVRATNRQVEQLLCWAEPFEKRTWAIESVGGLGYLLAQQFVAQGEEVLDVPATLASRIRVLATGRSDKNDPNDAHSIAIAALRAPALRSVEPADHGEVLRLLSKRNSDLGRQRSRVVCRLHALFAELSPGGIAREMYVSDAEVLLLLAMGVPLEVVSDTLGHASIRVTMDVYGHLLAPAKMQAADAMRQALWLDELPDFDPLATSLAEGDHTEVRNSAVTSDSVGRPGLDPGTLGLRERVRSSVQCSYVHWSSSLWARCPGS